MRWSRGGARPSRSGRSGRSAGRRQRPQQLPQRLRSGGPAGERPAVHEMQTLLLGEVPGRSGDPPLVTMTATSARCTGRAVPLSTRRSGVPTADPRSPSLRCLHWITQRRPNGSVAFTSAPRSPRPPTRAASGQPSRRISSRIDCSNSWCCKASNCAIAYRSPRARTSRQCARSRRRHSQPAPASPTSTAATTTTHQWAASQRITATTSATAATDATTNANSLASACCWRLLGRRARRLTGDRRRVTGHRASPDVMLPVTDGSGALPGR